MIDLILYQMDLQCHACHIIQTCITLNLLIFTHSLHSDLNIFVLFGGRWGLCDVLNIHFIGCRSLIWDTLNPPVTQA